MALLNIPAISTRPVANKISKASSHCRSQNAAMSITADSTSL